MSNCLRSCVSGTFSSLVDLQPQSLLVDAGAFVDSITLRVDETPYFEGCENLNQFRCNLCVLVVFKITNVLYVPCLNTCLQAAQWSVDALFRERASYCGSSGGVSSLMAAEICVIVEELLWLFRNLNRESLREELIVNYVSLVSLQCWCIQHRENLSSPTSLARRCLWRVVSQSKILFSQRRSFQTLRRQNRVQPPHTYAHASAQACAHTYTCIYAQALLLYPCMCRSHGRLDMCIHTHALGACARPRRFHGFSTSQYT
jgi:hypothetical protein